MPPSRKPTKAPAKAHGKDIRGFFEAGSSSRTPPTQYSAAPAASNGTKTLAIEISDEEDEVPAKKVTPVAMLARGQTRIKSEQVRDNKEGAAPSTLKRKKRSALVFSSDEEEEVKGSRPRKKAAVISNSTMHDDTTSKISPKAIPKGSMPKKVATIPKKREAEDDDFIVSSDSDRDSLIDDKPTHTSHMKGKSKQTKEKSIAKSSSTNETRKTSVQQKDTGKAENKSKPKQSWAAKAVRMAGPSAPGSKEVPEAADPSCLAGLSLVFTGELQAFSREEAIDLAKRFGGRVTTQPSSRTSYVVLGADAGPSKLAAIKKNNLSTLDEDGFLNLIATRIPDQTDEKTKKKIEKEQAAIRQAAKEMERREQKAKKEHSYQPDASTQLWTDRYAPQGLKEICGNKGQVEKLQLWLHDWSSSLKSNFKKPGKNGMNCSRAILISGPPGIGKTTSAHLCAKLEGFTPIELNASDARSKKLVENSTNISNTSLDGWIAGGHATNVAGIAITDKTCLIMDEVDGMSAGDRGGVGALTALIKKTKIPIICIANDKGALKLKSLANTAFNLPFKRPDASAIRSRILSIAFKEKMKIPANVIDQLITGSQSDIRQVLNMLSTWKLSSDSMNFDEGKTLSKMNEKYSVMTPFDVTHKMLGPYLFSATSRETLGDKIELYFHDHSFMPLFMQENYLKTHPSRIKNEQGPEKTLKHLELMDKAASSISDGDLVDSLIHGPEQHWSLMPLHAVCSTVRPASFLYGMGSGYGGPNAMGFPIWLGQNSRQNKLGRQLTDIQARMRLKVSGDKQEMRQAYIPALFPHLIQPLMEHGASAVDEVLEKMDDYFLNREDWDTIVELGLDQRKDELVLKRISPATKTALTRKYNAKDHPIAFHKAQDLGKAPKKIATMGPTPDLEEAYDVDDDIEDTTEEKSTEDDDDLTHDSLIKAPKVGKGSGVVKVKRNVAPKGKGRPRKV